MNRSSLDSVSCSACIKPGQLGNGIGNLQRLEFILQGSILGIDPSTPSDRLFARFEMPRLRCDQSVGSCYAKINTGDIATLDEDGFLRITDRLSRFSKIGGEMVPHIKIEDKLQEIAGGTEQSFAVTAIPDEKKGERLIVLHTLPEDKLRDCLAQLAKSDLPQLWKPRPDQFVHVDALPYLGTGKLDLRRLKEIAMASPA